MTFIRRSYDARVTPALRPVPGLEQLCNSDQIRAPQPIARVKPPQAKRPWLQAIFLTFAILIVGAILGSTVVTWIVEYTSPTLESKPKAGQVGDPPAMERKARALP